MPIEKGADWGGLEYVAEGTPIAASDAEAADLAAAGHQIVGLAGGDLCRTLGGRGDVASRIGVDGQQCSVGAIDVGIATLDGTEHLFVAHLVARGRWWQGSGAAVMNAEWLGDLRLAPRSHPGDTMFDITEGSLPWRQRRSAAQRALTGDHLPHPGLSMRRSDAASLTFPTPRIVFIDGRKAGRTRTVGVEMRPAALRVAV